MHASDKNAKMRESLSGTMHRKQHVPTDGQRQTVQLHTTVGTIQPVIAQILGIDAKTLRLHYRDELDLAKAKANATIGGALFNKAMRGDTAAMIFWMKTQAGWRETNVLEHTGTVKHEVGADEAFTALASLLGRAIPGPASDADPAADVVGDGTA
jgi:hypothetical protein